MDAQGEVVQGVQLWAEVPFILILLDKISVVPASKPSSEIYRLKATTSTAAGSTVSSSGSADNHLIDDPGRCRR